jgi:hypothetical protein
MITRGKRRLAAVALLIGGLVTTNVGAMAHASTPRVDISLPSAPLTIKAPGAPVRYDDRVKVTVHLGSAAAGRTVSVYAKPNGQKRTLLTRHAVDAKGNLVVTTPALHVLTVVTAVYAGDKSHAPTSVHRSIQVHAKITGHMAKGYGHTGSWTLYHQKQSPYVYTKVVPNKYCGVGCAGGVVFALQQYQGGKWVIVPTGGTMVPVTKRGDATVNFPVTHVVGDQFRIRTFIYADSDSAQTLGPWWKFRFTK